MTAIVETIHKPVTGRPINLSDHSAACAAFISPLTATIRPPTCGITNCSSGRL